MYVLYLLREPGGNVVCLFANIALDNSMYTFRPSAALMSNVFIRCYSLLTRSLDSSVGIATRYGLGVSGIESRWEARYSAPIQTGSDAH
jgi:hypothetical protein